MDCFWCRRNEHEHKREDSRVKYEKLESEMCRDDFELSLYRKMPLKKNVQLEQPHDQCLIPIDPQLFDTLHSDEVITQQPDRIHYSSDKPRIQFSLYYNFLQGTLSVKLISGTGFPARNKGRTPNLVVILFLIPSNEKIFQSCVQTTTHPVFHEVFKFSGFTSDEIRRQTLVLRVLNTDQPLNSEIGVAILPLKDADLYGIKMNAELTYKKNLLKPETNGDILVSLMYDPSEQLITGVLQKATNLERMGIGVLPDPYVKIFLYYKGKRESKWRSTIKKNIVIPIYNETFRFDISGMKICLVHLEVVVMNHNVVGSNEIIGKVEIGKGTGHSTGSLHWMEMLSSPCSLVSYWHSIRDPSSVENTRL